MFILVVDSDPSVLKSLELMLSSDGHQVMTADLGEDAVAMVRDYSSLDMMTLDLNLPDISGYDVLRRVRRLAGVNLPIIVVAGLNGIEDKVKALDLGADDYLVKPFHKDELGARIRAVSRRSSGFSSNIISIGDLSIDIDVKKTTLGGAPVHITVREFSLLELLIKRRNSVVTKEALFDCLYGPESEVQLKIIDVFICKVRAKLSAASGGLNYIETIWGRGYKAIDPGEFVPLPLPVDPAYEAIVATEGRRAAVAVARAALDRVEALA